MNVALEKGIPQITNKRSYDVIANRVVSAFRELNEALIEAHGCSEMRVMVRYNQDKDGRWKIPLRMYPVILKVTHAETLFTVNYEQFDKKDEMEAT